MHGVELILILLAIVTVLAAIAERTFIPYPIFLVLGGLILSLIPGVPSIELDPEVVFVIFLPPILFAAGYSTSWRDFRANLRPISLLAVGCVFFTTCAVAVVAHAAIDEFSWGTAFVLGAIVAPPDAVAATTVFQHLGVPRRIVTVLEGESLVNDASALVAYRLAVVAVVTGGFSAVSAGVNFLIVAAGGIGIGIAAGWLVNRLVPRVGGTSVTITATLLAPAAIFLLAEELGVSGVLATVVAGIIHGRRGSTVLDPLTRVRGTTVWDFIIFLINSLVFILIGLQLRDVRENLSEWSTGELMVASLTVIVTVVVTRIIWVYPATYLPRLIPRIRASDPAPPWRYPAVIAWAGLRGVVSLAAALALPLHTDAGSPFPQRDLLIFLTFAVILTTLVGQGLTLSPLVSWLGIAADSTAGQEETLARRTAAHAALVRIEQLEDQDWFPRDIGGKMKSHYEHMLEHLPESLDPGEIDAEHISAHDQLRREVILAQRLAVIDLRDRDIISDEALRRVERDLDLEELRSDI